MLLGVRRQLALPMGLNRISWKRVRPAEEKKESLTLPMGLNRISWKLNVQLDTDCRNKFPTDGFKSD